MKSLEFDPAAYENLAWWLKRDRKRALRIIKLFEDIQHDPFHGIGESEPLKHELAGCWSRRIDQEHRLVYQILDGKIRILACRYHH